MSCRVGETVAGSFLEYPGKPAGCGPGPLCLRAVEASRLGAGAGDVGLRTRAKQESEVTVS